MGQYTEKFKLYKPEIGETNWGDKVNQNFDIIDKKLEVSVSELKPVRPVEFDHVFSSENNFEGFEPTRLYGSLVVENGKLCLYPLNDYVGIMMLERIDNTSKIRVKGRFNGMEFTYNLFGIRINNTYSIVFGYYKDYGGWICGFVYGSESNYEIIQLNNPITDYEVKLEISNGKINMYFNGITRQIDVDFNYGIGSIGGYHYNENGGLSGVKLNEFEIISYTTVSEYANYYVIGRPKLVDLVEYREIEGSENWRRVCLVEGYGIARLMHHWYGDIPPNYLVVADGYIVGVLTCEIPELQGIIFKDKLEIFVEPYGGNFYLRDIKMLFIGHIYRIDRNIVEAVPPQQ